jgi:hypothetical protein
MSMPDATSHSRARWAVPVTAAVIGLGYLVAGIAGGNTGFGVFGLVLMLVVGAAFWLLGTRRETFRALADRRDERINAIDRDATLVSGAVLILAVIVMFMVEIARGGDGSPYYQLGGLGGVTYLVALVWLRFRR